MALFTLVYHLLPNIWKASYTIIASIFLMFRIDHPIAMISSSNVLYRVPLSGSFTLAKKLQSHGLMSDENGGCSRISHFQRRKRSVTAAAVWLLALSWRMMGFCTINYHHFLLSPCDYDLFTKWSSSNPRWQISRTKGYKSWSYGMTNVSIPEVNMLKNC